MTSPSAKDSWASIARVGSAAGLALYCTAATLAGCGVFGGEETADDMGVQLWRG